MGVSSSLLEDYGKHTHTHTQMHSSCVYVYSHVISLMSFGAGSSGSILKVADLLQRFKDHNFDFALGVDQLKVWTQFL